MSKVRSKCTPLLLEAKSEGHTSTWNVTTWVDLASQFGLRFDSPRSRTICNYYLWALKIVCSPLYSLPYARSFECWKSHKLFLAVHVRESRKSRLFNVVISFSGNEQQICIFARHFKLPFTRTAFFCRLNRFWVPIFRMFRLSTTFFPTFVNVIADGEDVLSAFAGRVYVWARFQLGANLLRLNFRLA